MKDTLNEARAAWLDRAVKYAEAFGRMRFNVPREGPRKGSCYRQPRMDRLLSGAQRLDDLDERLHLVMLLGDKMAMAIIPILISLVVVNPPAHTAGGSRRSG